MSNAALLHWPLIAAWRYLRPTDVDAPCCVRERKMPNQTIPHKPDYLSDSEWEFVLARDLGHCARYRKCSLTGQTDFCSPTADVDHAQPKELGGDDTVANVRLLCSGYNRGRICESLEFWREPNHWDREIVTGKLREIQRLVGWDAISDLEHAIANPPLFRRLLLGAITFIPGATGIGKSLLGQSVLFRFNKLVGQNYPRVRHVLWLTMDTTLRDLGAKEVEDEAYDLGIVDRRPKVHVAKAFNDLLRGPGGADVTFSVIQALWDREDDDGPMRSENEKRAALAHYDTIIFDECDWGNEQVRHISQIARNALQFALSASPLTPQIVADKERVKAFLSRFILIAPEAIADYTRALQLDACLKLLLEPATVGPKHTGFDYLRSGLVKTSDQNMPRDHALYRGLILQAVSEADNLETRMKQAHPESYYSPHIMVRMETIHELIAMYSDLQWHLKNLFDEGRLVNDGWDVCVIFMGRQFGKITRDLPDERDLAAKDKLGQWKHPFMLAKNNNGRAVKRKSKRILLNCNIGTRGINNWPINTIVDCTQRESVGDLIQFVWGRPVRLPQHLAAWTAPGPDKNVPTLENEFVTVKVWIPEVDGFEEKMRAIEASRDYIQNMLPLIRDAGFLTWADLLEGKRTTDKDVNIDVNNRPLTQSEKYNIQGAVAQLMEQTGALDENNIGTTVSRLFPEAGDRVRAKCTEYGVKLIDPEFRDYETIGSQLMNEAHHNPENVMDRLRPQEVYNLDDLKRWVRYEPRFAQLRQKYLDRIDENDELIIHLISDSLRQVQISNYRPAARIYRLHGTKSDPGVLPEVAGDLKANLNAAGQMPEDGGLVNQAMNSAAKALFDIGDASEGGPMDHPAYHIAILGKHRRRLQAMARGQLIRNGYLGSTLKRFAANEAPDAHGTRE
jgi:hypothetical protein